MTAKVCPKCRGFDPGCPVCGAPPRRTKTIEVLGAAGVQAIEVTWSVAGIDISGWNWPMNIPTAHELCQYAFVRVGYGNQWKDLHCDEFRRDLLANDMPYGVYWYVKAGEDWRAHADNFAELANDFPFQLDLVLDCEFTTLGPSETLNWLMNMDSRLRNTTGKVPQIYSSAGWWNTHVARNSYFNNHRKWVANWTDAPAPYMPVGWSTWNHWQWSADGNGLGETYGSGGDHDMDLDRYNGTIDQFNIQYGTHIKPIGDVPPVELPDKIYVNVSNLNIRSAPDARYSNVIGVTSLNKAWNPIALVHGPDANGVTREWWQINKYAYLAKWLCRL